ncbi:nucleic acid-binding protein [Amylostereum chailletii]|nr:nucleic acid-binding protein [Amylostereum chailletii]
MSSKKRQLEDSSSQHKSKKTKVVSKDTKKTRAEKPLQPASNIIPEEVDFPRGGGTSFTALEVKTLRAEAVKEANDELFKKSSGRQRRKSDVKGKGKATDGGAKNESSRIEHLNYKRITPGMKILAQVMIVHPLALIVSLPNQLAGHIPITQISSELTRSLETMDVDEAEDEEDGDEDRPPAVPDLSDIFQPGQYVRCIVSAMHAHGSTDGVPGTGRTRDEVEKASRRVELSLLPEQVNEGVVKADLKPGYTMSASVKSIEDHGYILNLGIPDISGFLSFKDAQRRFKGTSKLHIGRIIDVAVSKLSSNGRTCNVMVASSTLKTSTLSEVSSVTSVVPGQLVQCLITNIPHDGLNVQVLGYFDGTLDEYHIPTGEPSDRFKLGQKVKARVLYEIPGTSPPRFALSLAAHVLSFVPKSSGDDSEAGISIQEAFPVGAFLDAVKVVKVEPERGLLVDTQSGLRGFVHISHVSDEHVPSLSSSAGAWKVGTSHRARVTGYFPLDGLLQLSMRPSILEQKFLQVADVQPGELIKGTVKKLTDSALFVSISGSVDGVIFPNHYADITLKHPQKRFKPGGSIKCRVLAVDPERKRIALTAKKTLVESELPTITSYDDAKVGMIAHAVVFRVAERRLQIEFFNNVKGSVPGKEASEAESTPLSTAFSVGKPIRVRIIAVDVNAQSITASIRQASSTFDASVPDISSVEIGSIVHGVVVEIHKENIVLKLKPSGVRALLSLKNLANHRSMPVAQLRGALKLGEDLEGLFVVTREPEKGFVIVANRPKTKPSLEQKHALSMDTITVGQVVGGRILGQNRNGTRVKLSGKITGGLHPTDTSDDYEAGTPFPNADTILRAVVLGIDNEKKHLTLSTRASRMQPQNHPPVVDKEIVNVSDLKVGQTVRGFVKSVPEHGLFVALGRTVDARVQIKELFDEFVQDWKARFQINQLVKARVLRIDVEKNQVELTFRSGELSKSALALSDLTEGQKVEGWVKRVEDYGLFIEIKDSKLSGLCHKTELSDNKDADTTLALRSFREGDQVKAIIRSIDLDKKRIAFGLKPSYFFTEDFNSDPESDSGTQLLGVVEDVEMSDAESDGEEAKASFHGSEEESSDEEDAMAVDFDMNAIVQGAPPTSRPHTTAAPSLQLGGFQWNGGDLEKSDESDSSDDSDQEDTSGKKKKKKKKKEIELDLTADLQTKPPDSNADFERVLLGSPNSSYIWIQYMSFLLQLSDVDKAREVGKRALKTIGFREEQEKLNVWIALLNLENVYGTDESLEAMFKDAARHCDSKTVHLRLATIFEQSEKLEKAEEQYKRTSKKFGYSSKVWTLFGEYYLKRGEVEEARKLLPRSLQSLEKRKHLKTISKFAQLEYKIGDPERGKTIFEGIVDSHPKRWDLWSIYIDMEAGQQDMQSVRHIFDRVLAHEMTSHKAKSFFKKWLDIERRLGDEEGAETVKAKAIEWTQRAANDSVDAVDP